MDVVVKIDGKGLAEVSAATAAVFVEPYRVLLERLHSEGRVTDAEMDALAQEVADRAERLSDLIPARMQQANDEDGPA